jgi:hypothetical protein
MAGHLFCVSSSGLRRCRYEREAEVTGLYERLTTILTRIGFDPDQDEFGMRVGDGDGEQSITLREVVTPAEQLRTVLQ